MWARRGRWFATQLGPNLRGSKMNEKILAATTLESIRSTTAHTEYLTSVNVATALSQLTKIRLYHNQHNPKQNDVDDLVIKLLAHLEHLLGTKPKQFDSRFTATLVHLLSKFSDKSMYISPESISRFEKVVSQVLNSAKIQPETVPLNDLSMIAWGLAKRSNNHINLAKVRSFVVQSLLYHLNQGSAAYSTRDLALLCWAIAKFPTEQSDPYRLNSSAFVPFEAIATAILRMDTSTFSSISPQSLSCLCLGFAHSTHSSPTVSQVLSLSLDHLVQSLPRYSCREISNIVWAFTKNWSDDVTCPPDISLKLSKVCQHLVSTMGELKAQEIANVCWSCAKLSVTHEPFFALVKQSLLHALSTPHISTPREWQSHHFSIVLWAFSKLGQSDSHLLSNVVQLLQSHPSLISSSSPQVLSNIVFALAKPNRPISVPPNKLLLEIARQSIVIIKQFKHNELSTLLWGFAKMRVLVPELFTLACKQLSQSIGSMTLQEASMVSWAVATTQSNSPTTTALLSRMAPLILQANARSTLSSGEISALSCIAWSYAVTGLYDTSVVQSILTRNWDAIELPITECTQLHWCHLGVVFELNRPEYGLTVNSFTAVRRGMETVSEPPIITSEQCDVADVLRGIGYPNRVIELQIDDRFSVDIGLREQRLAIELQGDGHFVEVIPCDQRGPFVSTYEPNGPTLFKQRLLHHMGWKVLMISCRTWQDLTGRAEKQKYLKQVCEGLLTQPQLQRIPQNLVYSNTNNTLCLV
eukprot:c6790_g1_i1.p1 GENE.c6790_g1_i1~~c6790_g1_i1.p1  ORF type:complete len:754 (-),score=145.65 c6790_g1_i1:1206-3467(-)